jgi:hypothetical protein
VHGNPQPISFHPALFDAAPELSQDGPRVDCVWNEQRAPLDSEQMELRGNTQRWEVSLRALEGGLQVSHAEPTVRGAALPVPRPHAARLRLDGAFAATVLPSRSRCDTDSITKHSPYSHIRHFRGGEVAGIQEPDLSHKGFSPPSTSSPLTILPLHAHLLQSLKIFDDVARRKHSNQVVSQHDRDFIDSVSAHLFHCCPQFCFGIDRA